MPMSLPTVFISLVGLFLVGRFWRRHPSYPPGPKGLPFLGVAKEHPKVEFWKTYAEWGRKYGNVGFISFHLLGRRMVVLNSLSVADALLNKRSTIYSDRPLPPMAGQLMRREKSIFYIPNDDRFKIYRRFMHRTFNPVASQTSWPLVEKEARTLVASMIETPDDFVQHIHRNASAVTMKVAYGYTVEKNGDYFVGLAEEGIRVGSLSVTPGKWLVDSFPALMYWPEWLPGGSFKRQARRWRKKMYEMSLEPHQYVKKQMAAGTAIPSFTSSLLESEPEPGVSIEEHDDMVFWSAGAIYIAGSDTTAASMKAFYLLMILYPDIQKRAKVEIDGFIARERRLPALRDKLSLPYAIALMQEVFRWAPPMPLGVFHSTSEDDEFQGYFIPQNTTIVTNIWAMTHDPELYPDPFKFDPERFLPHEGGGKTQCDPRTIIFGFGRRICAGQHLAEASVFMQIVTTLATLDLSKPLDIDGGGIEPEVGFTTGVISHVRPYKIHITCRSQDTLDLLHKDVASLSH